MIIDVHNHYIPEEIARAYGAEPGKPVTVMENGIPKRMVHDLSYVVDVRLSNMKKAGVSMQVVSTPMGWDTTLTLEQARKLNDYMSNLQNANKGKFIGLAAIPTGSGEDDKEVAKELHRAIGDLGLRGVSIPAQPFRVPMDDPKHWPFYKEAEALDAAIFIHPSSIPNGFDAIAKYDLHRIVGREYELSAVICRLIFGGVLDRFPNLKLVFSHFGGGIAGLLERIEPKNKPWKNTELPGNFIDDAKRLYYDTAGFVGGPHAFRLGYDILGASRLLFGSDYPQDFTDPKGIKKYINFIQKNVKPKDFDTIMYKNTVKVFGLDSYV